MIARLAWLCDGCGRWRPRATTKYVITEGREIVGQLCVFCCVRQDPAVSDELRTEAAHAGGVEDPFGVDDLDVAKVWEEVFGGSAEQVAEELSGGRQGAFNK